MSERLIYTELGENSNKFWNGSVEGTVCKTNWGRVGDIGQSKDYQCGNTWSAENKLQSLVRSKLRKGYTRQLTVSSGTTTVHSPTNIKSVAASQIKHGGDKETIELINFLVARNIHAIEGTTTIRYVDGGLQTPLGPVTPDGLDLAAQLLNDMERKTPDFEQLANRYLRIVPRVIGRRGADPHELFGSPENLKAENDLLAALRAVVVTGDVVGQVFRTSLAVVASTAVDFKAINKAFQNTMNRNHVSASLKLKRVWEMDIDGAAKAFKADLKPVQRLWHGTKDANLLSILKGGYVIPSKSSSIAVTGRMYGDGVYFSDQSTKSLNYATGSAPGQYSQMGSQRKFMIFNDVAMGNVYKATRSFGGTPPAGYDSCFAEGGKSGVRNNEMIVYKTNQVNPRFLCEFVN